MSGEGYIAALRAEIERSLDVLQRVESYYDEYTATALNPEDPTRENRIVIAEILANYYTGLETIFLRISQFFENQLSTDRWHGDLCGAADGSSTAKRILFCGLPNNFAVC
ncbi:MAG: hypothetical protein ACLFUX_06850 [Spirochaetaceae bacterium]